MKTKALISCAVTADLCLHFHIGKNPGFSLRGSNIFINKSIFKAFCSSYRKDIYHRSLQPRDTHEHGNYKCIRKSSRTGLVDPSFKRLCFVLYAFLSV